MRVVELLRVGYWGQLNAEWLKLLGHSRNRDLRGRVLGCLGWKLASKFQVYDHS